MYKYTQKKKYSITVTRVNVISYFPPLLVHSGESRCGPIASSGSTGHKVGKFTLDEMLDHQSSLFPDVRIKPRTPDI